MSCIHRRASAHDTIQIFFCERISFIWKRKSISSSPLPSLFNKKIEGKRKKKKWGYFKKSAVGYWPEKSNFSSLPLSGRKEKRENEKASSFPSSSSVSEKENEQEQKKKDCFSYFHFHSLLEKKKRREGRWIRSCLLRFPNKKEKWK